MATEDKTSNADSLLNVRVMSSTGVLFNDKVCSLSSQNSKGKFDVLPQHANFITLVENRPIVVVRKGGEKVKWEYRLAVIHVIEDSVNIYVQLV